MVCDLIADFTPFYYFVGAVKLTKNGDWDKYCYSGYGTRFYSRSLILFLSFNWDKNVVIFGVDSSSSVRIDNKKKYILVVGVGPAKRLDETIQQPKLNILLFFSRSERKCCLSLYYNECSFLFVDATKTYQFKATVYQIKPYQEILENISKGVTASNMKNRIRSLSVRSLCWL